jgi:cysteine desulfurase / selenocysteine lyase
VGIVVHVHVNVGMAVQANHRPEQVRDFLKSRGITVWVSAITSTRIDFEQRGLTAVVRASVHYYNTQAELDVLTEALRELTGTSGR